MANISGCEKYKKKGDYNINDVYKLYLGMCVIWSKKTNKGNRYLN